MAHPIIKWNPNQEYACEMLGGPWDKDGNYGPTYYQDNPQNAPQWKYLIKVGGDPHYWYSSQYAHEMIEELRFNTKGAPFTVLKRVEGTDNLGFEIAGKTHDDIFGDPRVPSSDNQPTEPLPAGAATPHDPLAKLEAKMRVKFEFIDAELKRIDGAIELVKKLVYDLGQPFPAAKDQEAPPPLEEEDIPF